MRKFIYTKSFVFNKAQYVLSDDDGNRILLEVDYKNNRYLDKTLKKNGKGYTVLKKEAEKVAKDLLRRKSGTNFAGK